MVKIKLQHYEQRIINYLYANKVITSYESPEITKGTYKQAANVLLRMEKKGVIKKVERGVYTLGVTKGGLQKEIFYKEKQELNQYPTDYTEQNGFTIDNNWVAPKLHKTDEKFLKELATTIKGLVSGQSIPIPFKVIKEKISVSTNPNSALRYSLNSILPANIMGSIVIYTIKDENGKLNMVRVYKK